MRKRQPTKLKPFGTTLPEDLIGDLHAEVSRLKRENPRVTIASVVEQAVRWFVDHNQAEREKVQ